MLQAQIISLVLAFSGAVEAPEFVVAQAAKAYSMRGNAAAREAFTERGYHPFSWGVVNDRQQAADAGLSHCAALPSGTKLLCARLVARLIDSSPVHLHVRAAPGFTLMYAHVVDATGRVRKLLPDAAGIFDLPVDRQGHAVGVSLRGPLGPETGLYFEIDQTVAPHDPCGPERDLSGLLNDINQARRAIGHQPLTFRLAPQGYAAQRSEELTLRFGHSRFGLAHTLKRHRLKLRHAAEVVAEDSSLAAICRSWLRSPSHRAALLDGRRDGIAFVQSGERLNALLWAKR
jgi:hypothetical protein